MSATPITRPMHAADLNLLSEFWYDRMVLLQQFNPRIRLMRDARAQWELQLLTRLDDPSHLTFTAELNQEIIGGIVGVIQPNSPGLLPEQIVSVSEFMVDLHSPQVNAGVGRVMINALRERVAAMGLEQVEVLVSMQASVEQAFWRGIGARTFDHLFWIKI